MTSYNRVHIERSHPGKICRAKGQTLLDFSAPSKRKHDGTEAQNEKEIACTSTSETDDSAGEEHHSEHSEHSEHTKKVTERKPNYEWIITTKNQAFYVFTVVYLCIQVHSKNVAPAYSKKFCRTLIVMTRLKYLHLHWGYFSKATNSRQNLGVLLDGFYADYFKGLTVAFSVRKSHIGHRT